MEALKVRFLTVSRSISNGSTSTPLAGISQVGGCCARDYLVVVTVVGAKLIHVPYPFIVAQYHGPGPFGFG
jgi:hypothetical protein